MNIISTNFAPAAVGPYSQAILTNDGILYTSGQIGIDPETGSLRSGIEAQTKQVLTNLKHILEEAEMEFSNVVKTTVFITDMTSFGVVNSIYGDFFKGCLPARSCVAVSSLPKGALIEIEVIASL